MSSPTPKTEEAAYFIGSYDITDHEAYERYVAGVVPLLQKHGAEVLVADYDAHSLEGEKRGFYVVLRFSSQDAALAWYHDPAYASVKQIRLDNTNHANAVMAKAFVPPSS